MFVCFCGCVVLDFMVSWGGNRTNDELDNLIDCIVHLSVQ